MITMTADREFRCTVSDSNAMDSVCNSAIYGFWLFVLPT